MDHDNTSTPISNPVTSLATQPNKVAPTKQRYASLDTLRGFALLGILVPNIWHFAWPTVASTDPTSVMSDAAANMQAQDITSIFFLGKFMFNFALLFGAGVVMYGRKFDTADEHGKFHKPLTTGTELSYIRCSILLVFGMIHAYLFWYGDILTSYAIAGLTLLWWVRRFNPKTQLLGGLSLFVFGALIMAAVAVFTYISYENGRVTPEQMSGNPLREIEGYSGSFFDAFKTRVFTTMLLQVFFVVLYLPAVWGMMIMGMALTRMGILTGEKSTRTYITLAAIFLPIGLITTYLAYNAINKNFELYPGFVWQSTAQAIGIPLAFGYTFLIIALSKLDWAKLITTPLAAVGRMALTNYFAHTLLCTTFFYGYGLGYFAQFEYPQLWLVVLSVWTFNIIFSLLWLRAFKMGPFEWLWRCLTYRRLVPIR